MIVHDTISALADLIWPPRCIACNVRIPSDSSDPTALFCAVCAASLMPIESPRCPRCALPFEGIGEDHLCGECLADPPPFSRGVSLFQYGEAAANAVMRLKYGARPHLATVMGRALFHSVQKTLSGIDLIVPVPLHCKRLHRRGYNQSALLARPVSRGLEVPLRGDVVVRPRETVSQAGLSRDARRKNLVGAFDAPNPEAVHGKRVLIVDDVITTGTTVREISRVLIRAGAKQVDVAAFARSC